MTSEQLAAEVKKFVAACQERILGTGKDQYDNGQGQQKFEEMSVLELLTYFDEELMDIANYSVMMHIRLRRIREALEGIAHETETSPSPDGGSSGPLWVQPSLWPQPSVSSTRGSSSFSITVDEPHLRGA